MKLRLAALCALLPSAALAQPTQDPNASDPYAPTTSTPMPAQPAPTTTTTTTVATTPAAPPPPVVVVNPQPQPRTVIDTTPQYETVTDSYNAPVFTTGALVFLGSYGASVIVAASSSKENLDRGNDRLYVPVVGPWLALNDRGSCPITSSSCDSETTAKVLLVADGIFQAAGLITMIDGVLAPSTHRVVTRTSKVDTKVHVVPTAMTTQTTTSPGVSVFGRF